MNQPRTIPVDLEKLIHSLDQKLPRTVLVSESKPYLELWKVSVEYCLVDVRKKVEINHARKMKLAYLSQGNAGLLEYIEPFIANKTKFKVIQQVILAIK